MTKVKKHLAKDYSKSFYISNSNQYKYSNYTYSKNSNNNKNKPFLYKGRTHKTDHRDSNVDK